MRKQRTSGPTASLSGLHAEIEKAHVNRIKSDDVPNLLSAVRRHEPGAEESLINGLIWLIYEVAGNGTKHFKVDVLSTLYFGLRTAIRRLADNDIQDAEKFIRDELCRSQKDFFCAESDDIKPPASTVCNRRNRGVDDYDPLRRKDAADTATIDEDGNEMTLNHLDDPDIRSPLTDQRGKNIQNPDSPSGRDIGISATDIDRHLDLTDNQQEREVLELLEAGASVMEIAESLGHTRHRVEVIVKKIKQRAIRYGYGAPTLSSKSA